MNSIQFSEPRNLAIYMQQALRPISKRYYYSSYVNSLPLKPTDRIIEIGSGIGAMAELLAQKVPDGQLTCVDISRRYLSTATQNLRKYSNAILVNGNLSQLNFNSASYDAINIHYVLHDVPKANQLKMINEMYSLLRPGGKVYLREPLKDSHGMPSEEVEKLFLDAGFFQLYQNESKIRIIGNVVTACYAKIYAIKFFLV